MNIEIRITKPSKRLDVSSFSAKEAEPDETHGNLLIGGPRHEVPKDEGGSLIQDDSDVFTRLEAAGFSLADKFIYERYATTYWTLRKAGALVGKVSSSASTLSIALYRDQAAYLQAREALVGRADRAASNIAA
jgi:hypothetical protein